MSKCAICNSQGNLHQESYDTGEKDFNGNNIIIKDFKVFHCSKPSCGNEWVSQLELDRVEDEVTRCQRIPPTKEEINTIWQSLNFSTKSAAAKFLNLNSKAFTKWVNGYSELSSAYDLLLRLAVHSKDNFNFIQYLHDKNFKFDKEDYQLVSESLGCSWNFQNIKVTVDPKNYKKEDLVSPVLPGYVTGARLATNALFIVPGGETQGEAA